MQWKHCLCGWVGGGMRSNFETISARASMSILFPPWHSADSVQRLRCWSRPSSGWDSQRWSLRARSSPHTRPCPGYFNIGITGLMGVVFVNCRYPAESLTLLIVGDRSEDIQHGGVSPALVNLENKEIWSEDITMSLILCNRRKCWSSSLPSPEWRIGNLDRKKYWIIWTIM